MDPFGFAMDHYDGIGAWRDKEGTYPIDAAAKLPDGPTFDGLLQLTNVLKGDARFPRCLAQQFFTYALGREPLEDDRMLVDQLTTDFSKNGFRMKELIRALVVGKAFQFRGGKP